jgi:NADH-quinone oxidoreductase subunit M
VAFLFLGFYPKPALDLLNPAVSKTLTFVGVEDPAPTNAADGSAK